MTDDERLAALFRDAASDAPPPRFGHDDVVAASRRITARRRSAAVAAAVTVGLVGLGAAIVLPGTGDSPTSAAAPLNAPGAADRQGGDYAGGSADPDEESGAGSAAPPVIAAVPELPLGPGTTTCADQQDPALRALVEQVLPEVAAARAAPTPQVCLPGADRYLALEVVDRGVAGVLSVAYLAPGARPQLVPGALSAPTASGGTVIVGSTTEVDGAAAPFADRLPALLEFLAPRL